MQSAERVMNLITGSDYDRRPWTAILSLYGAGLTGVPLTDYYSSPDLYAAGQQAVAEIIRPDILFGPFCLPMLGAAFGSELKLLADQAPNLRKPAIRDISRINDLQIPRIGENSVLNYFSEAIRLTAQKYSTQIPLAAISLSPLDLPVMLLGLDGWLNTFLFDSDGTKKMLDLTIPFFIDWTNNLLSQGAACVVLPCPFISPAIVPAEIAREKALPVYQEVFKRINGALILHHGGAVSAAFAEMYQELPANVIGLCLDERDDYRQVKAINQGRRVLFYGQDGPNLYRSTPEKIYRRWQDELTGFDQRSILYTCSADVPVNTPLENIQALAQAVANA